MNRDERRRRGGHDKRCPHCGQHNQHAARAITTDDVAEGMAQLLKAPEAGDVSVCVDCGGVSIFTGPEGGKRMPYIAEMNEIMADDEVIAAVRAVHDRLTERPEHGHGIE